MAYTTRARVDLLVGAGRVASLLDRNGDGLEDAGVCDDVIGRAGNRIDTLLSRLYTTPFASYPSTPGVISDACDYLAASLLYQTAVSVEAEEVRKYSELAYEILRPLIDGLADIPGATKLDASESTVSVTGGYTAGAYAGVIYDVSGNQINRGGRAF
jgi:phage gp36-like protein